VPPSTAKVLTLLPTTPPAVIDPFASTDVSTTLPTPRARTVLVLECEPTGPPTGLSASGAARLSELAV
jgi:hypothetical protein